MRNSNGGPGKHPSGRMSLFTEFLLLFKKHSRYLDEQAKFDFDEFKKLCENIEKKFNVSLKGLKILEIGCGQRFPHSLLFTPNNDVSAVDTNVILTGWSPSLLYKLFIRDGFKRSVKTIIRKALFDNKYHRELARLYGGKLQNIPQIHCMFAEDLKFPDDEFDFIFSIAVFEHIADVEKVTGELYRVLKPGGIFAVGINVFTGITGGHNLIGEHENDLLGPDKFEFRAPPWDHLRSRSYPSSTYLNELRIDDYKKVFEKRFSELYFHEEEHPQHEEYLTDEIRKELVDFSTHELFTDCLLITGRK